MAKQTLKNQMTTKNIPKDTVSKIKAKKKPDDEEEITEEMILASMIEHDIYVRMPPKKKYTVEIIINSIKKAEPRVVDPEEVWWD